MMTHIVLSATREALMEAINVFGGFLVQHVMQVLIKVHSGP